MSPAVFRPLAFALLATAALLLGGCATVRTEGGTPIDTSRTAKGQDSRVLFLVIHYTAEPFERSMTILTERQVSAHYLVSDEPQPRVFRLVDENRRAWHSGASAWGPNKRLNSSSIGIEITNPGYRTGPDKQPLFAPYPEAQMAVVIDLIRDIVKRHNIKPEYILGHGEVTPSYKVDPGPTFPWKRLAELGITPPWPDAAAVAAQRALFEAAPPGADWWQKTLAQHGYAIERTGQFDKQTQRVIMNFQMRYRPEKYDGQPDAESAALLQVVVNPQGMPPAPPLPLPPPEGPVFNGNPAP